MKTIEATGNTKEEAEVKLRLQRQNISAQTNAEFGGIKIYGNFEVGYKFVQAYREGI